MIYCLIIVFINLNQICQIYLYKHDKTQYKNKIKILKIKSNPNNWNFTLVSARESNIF